MFISLLFIISLSHQIQNKEKIKSKLMGFYLIVFWQIVFFGFLTNRPQPTNILIYLFFILLFFGSMALAAIGVYFGGKINDVKVNGFMAIISLLIFLLAIFISVFLSPDISILLGIVGIFIIINLLAYLASRLWFKKQPEQTQ
jgi:FtsH-binding integral membrane protein